MYGYWEWLQRVPAQNCFTYLVLPAPTTTVSGKYEFLRTLTRPLWVASYSVSIETEGFLVKYQVIFCV